MTTFPAVYESPPGTCQCTAALLTTFVALTSAHCIIGLSPVNISIASHDKYENVKNQNQNVKQVIIHDNFIQGTFENDIALLVLTEGLDIDNEKYSVLLPKRNTNYIDAVDFVTWVNGKSKLDALTTNYYLIKKRTNLFENRVCKKAFPTITGKHMCASTRGLRMREDCNGFLMCYDKYLDGYLCGIISIGNNYIHETMTLFTNIQSSIEWIHASIMKLGNISSCQKHEFQCNISNACIRQKLVCDGRNDCGSGDNSDEENCKDVNGCHWSQHGCRKGNQCIPGHLKCDGKLDCKDGSDEENCHRSRNMYSMESCADSEFSCNVTTICISLESVCNGINDGGGIDDSDERDCRQVNGCHWTQHSCRLGNKCIPRSQICDGKKNCEDGSDEEHCLTSRNRDRMVSCSEKGFLCNVTMICISLSDVCNGIKDCGDIDGSDEEDCRQVNGCHWTQHACRLGNKCILRSAVCDGVEDCSDGSDEENCSYRAWRNCNSEQFTCNISKICIDETSVCNGANDCGITDTSDEENCRDLDGCHPTQFACHKGNKCIPKVKMCDQQNHCRDGSDEKKCTSTERTNGPLRCKVSNKKYYLYNICDGYRDCGEFDGSDEENCQQGKHGCLWTQFPCRISKRCLSGDEKCDGKRDCDDGSDEENCLDGSSCYWTHFACPNSTECFPRRYICNGRNDCRDGSDEKRCDDGSRCHWSEFECHDKSGCIPGHFYFDGVTHCSDGSDERDTLNETLETNTGTLAPYWYSLLGIVIILGIPFIILYRKYRRRSDLLTSMEIELFEKGDGNQIRAGQFAHENAQFIPYNQEFEIKWEDFTILEDQKLGEGAFGIVFKGQLAGHSNTDNIAVKTTKPKVDRSILLALMSELKVMIHLEMHENIVQLLGACTEFLREGRVYVLVEYCPLGSLDLHLRTTVRTKLDNLVSINEQTITNQEIPGTIDSLSGNVFVNWAVQIARGMQHLESKRVIHGDLATRNVLLYSENHVKITDFGLSRQLLNYDNYVKQSQTKLPWRWLAIETLSRPKFASEEIYKVMMRCWEFDPEMRPDFKHIEDVLRTLFQFPSSSDYCDISV
ncbi:unnamed protein product [Allacma fusca]|uniref:Uncharacterized protein n=1 Tax=Allacma fusca TaxID=39272 RepID=A0A8J2K864_9HEXA|nr:unnamed protein product [Allacma fusca]